MKGDAVLTYSMLRTCLSFNCVENAKRTCVSNFGRLSAVRKYEASRNENAFSRSGVVLAKKYGTYREKLLDRLGVLEEENRKGCKLGSFELGQSRFIHDGRDAWLDSFEDHLFSILREDKEKVSVTKFVNELKTTGLRVADPRLEQCMNNIKQLRHVAEESTPADPQLDQEAFRACIKENLVLIKRAFMGDFVIPEFPKFCEHVNKLYLQCRTNNGGTVASYIPQLSRYSPDHFGMSVCTIDGQRQSLGDVKVPFCLQSCSKPLAYGLALDEMGCQAFHEYVGQEPSGVTFNAIALDKNSKPHNPMINAGAIVTASLLKPNLRLADRFEYVSQQFKRMAGREFIGFNNSVFLSERETADRNFALGYYLKEYKCFPNGVNLMETMDFYFQMCSVEVDCESGSLIAATLANGGICPLTGEQVLSADAIRNTLSLMHSCGMYDYSGQFAFSVGLPAKSGVSGAILLVVPNVMGICLWSPPLDNCGNSVRGIQFCESLVNKFNFHQFDNLQYTRRKHDPRRSSMDRRETEVTSLLFGAYHGDIGALTRMALSGSKMSRADYDGRTALHLAAAEGHLDCVRFLLETCKVPAQHKDRWDRTPHDDAVQYGHTKIASYIEAFISNKNKESLNETENVPDSSEESVSSGTQTTEGSTAISHKNQPGPPTQTNEDLRRQHDKERNLGKENSSPQGRDPLV